ncbi:MAG: protein phosphatase 2C domain-containing protein [Clostridiales bacterium]|nr:protein phosphatase 2C domain-containing protein [Clostridiales bacterium]
MYSNAGSREKNEDYISSYADGDRICFVIADGLGGEGEGDMASRFVCNHTVAIAEKTKKFNSDFLKDCFTIIQKNLLRAKKELMLSTEMCSTLSILAFDGNSACWGHIGDSRIYCFSEDKIQAVTTDHSLAYLMISGGMSEETDVRNHPDRSILMAAMGMENMNEAYEIDMSEMKMRRPVSFLMCTDGFWQYVHEDEMLNIIGSEQTAEAVMNKMVKTADLNSEGEDRDNISAIYIKYIPE